MSKHYQITIKEVGLEKLIITEHVGNIDKRKLVVFFGLKEPDIEWYQIKKL